MMVEESYTNVFKLLGPSCLTRYVWHMRHGDCLELVNLRCSLSRLLDGRDLPTISHPLRLWETWTAQTAVV